jgi:sortase A
LSHQPYSSGAPVWIEPSEERGGRKAPPRPPRTRSGPALAEGPDLSDAWRRLASGASPVLGPGVTDARRRGFPAAAALTAGLNLSRTARRRLTLGAASFLLVLSLALLAEGVLTVVWQEPFTALIAHHQQQALSSELGREEAAALAQPALGGMQKLSSGSDRLAMLAGRLERRPAGKPLGRIHIPRTGTSFVFVAGTDAKSLARGPGHYTNTALPGQRGTVAIAGHRTTYLAPFRNLDQLRRGDEISLKMPYGRFRYSVEGSLVVSPSNSRSLRPVHHDRLVLTTCTPPFSAAKRLVVTARLRRAVPVGAARARLSGTSQGAGWLGPAWRASPLSPLRPR